MDLSLLAREGELVAWAVQVRRRDGAVVYQSPAIPWSGGDSGTWWVGYANGDQILPGAWEFEIYFDNQVVGTGSVQLF